MREIQHCGQNIVDIFQYFGDILRKILKFSKMTNGVVSNGNNICNDDLPLM